MNFAPKTYKLSAHAVEQTKARTDFDPAQLAEHLSKTGVLTRSQPGGDTENIAFWSPRDEWPFIAIANRFTGDVLTVLEAVHRSLPIDVTDWTDPRTILNDGKSKELCEWASLPRWCDIACAIRKAGCEIPQWIAEYVQIEFETNRRGEEEARAEAAKRRSETEALIEASGRYMTFLRVTLADGATLIAHGGDPRSEMNREYLLNEAVSPHHGSVFWACVNLIGRLEKRGLSFDDIEAVSMEVRAFLGGSNSNPKVGSVVWAEPLMAMGVPGRAFTEVLASAIRRNPRAEALLAE